MSGARTLAVVGGGLIGLSVAEEMQRRGWQVTLFEPGPCAGAASRVAGGMLGSVAEAETQDDRWLRLALDSRARYPEWIERLQAATSVDCGYRREGTLFVAVDRDELGEIDRLVAILERKSLEVERLDRERLLALEPRLSPRTIGGLRIEEDRQVDPRALLEALRLSFTGAGGVHVDRPARAIEPCGGAGLKVTWEAPDATGRESREFDAAVVAAGAWAERGLELPLPEIRLRPVKGQLIRLRGEPLLEHVVRTSEVYLVPRRDGQLLVGASSEEMGFDLAPTAGVAMDLLRAAWEIVPGCYELECVEHAVGLRSAGPDHLPWVGPTSVEGLFLAVGHYRNGVLLAPSTAALLADCIDAGATPELLAPFAPDRRMRQNTLHGR